MVENENARVEAEICREEQAAALQAELANLQKLEAKRRKQIESLQVERQGQSTALQAKETELANLQKQLENKEQQLSAANENVEVLTRWMEGLETNISALLNSRRWRAGHALGTLYRSLLLSPKVPMAHDALVAVMNAFQSWYRSYKQSINGSGQGKTEPNHPRRSVKGEELPPSKPSMSKEELARQIRERIGPTPERAEWPSVSIVVLNHNGQDHLSRLFSGLQNHTDYPDFEVVLVDNGSIDGSVELAKSFEAKFPVKLIENPGNVSFSAGNNQGVEAATSGRLLLFLNNDVEPFEAGWLKELVNCIENAQARAVGALLLYPSEVGCQTANGYTVQHRGIRFYRDEGVARAFNLGNCDDALGEHLGNDTICPAATAAGLLIERNAFHSVGGFTKGYSYGTEDVDLGLKLTASGRKVVSSGRAVLFHHEFGTQKAQGRDFMRINRTGNHQLFLERWGPQIHRELLLDRLDSAEFWTEGPTHLAITITSHNVADGYGDWYTAHELGDALERRGWRISYVQRKNQEWYSLPEDTDYLLVLLDAYDISRVSGVTTIAWIRNWMERWVQQPWFEKFDVVLASSAISASIVEQSTNKTAHLFPIATNPKHFSRTPPNPVYEADYVFTGNYWGTPRTLINHLDVTPEETFMIFGKGWEKDPRLRRYVRGQVAYDQLPQVYSSAKLVLDDAAHSTLPYQSINSRVFDALATGTLVITNCERGARELFDEDFPTYTDRRELRANLDLLLGDESRRIELAKRYKEIVLREHTYERRAEQLMELLRERVMSLSFCIKIGAPSWDVAQSWGDLHLARAMKRQLERRGHRCLIQVLDEWDNFEGLEYDVVVHLKGLTPYVPKPSQFNVLWNISHPEQLTVQECDRYDLVFVASERWAQHLRAKTSARVSVLEQATDPEVFFPDPDSTYEHELVFVGNSRKVERRILRDLLPTERDLAVWGGNWESLIPEKHVIGRYLPNEQVRKAYSSASIVLNDHWDDMQEHGFISNRIYDALACGALVISDHLSEIEERFGDAVVTYQTPDELNHLIDHYLDSPDERVKKGRRGRELVLSRHTLEHRMGELLRHVRQRMDEKDFRTRIHPSA
jgi:GT2 family glycosyltransferase/spore maturation protein CgeB